MAVAVDFPSFASGEISPNMIGRTDLARLKTAATTMRNMFVRYTGGAYSRAGTAFVGYSKQTGRSYPPRLIPFQFNNDQGLVLEFGNNYMRVIFQGALVTDTTLNITAATKANPCVVTLSASTFSAGDWVYITGVGGMTQLNGRTCVLGSPSGANYPLKDVFGNNIDSTAFTTFTSGGTAARIYTLATPWAEQDLPYLKFTESADTVSFACLNQVTQTEYPPYDLTRIADSNWTLNAINTAPTIAAPGTVTLSITPTPSGANAYAHYQYVATAVSAADGSESVASPIGDLSGGVDIAAYSGSVSISTTAVAGASYYNFYKATPGFSYSAMNIPAPPVGSQFAYIGYSFGPQFLDNNITPDFTQLPPLHQNPFARGQINSVSVNAQGTGYTHATATITTATGSGAVVECVIQGGSVVAYVVADPGTTYALADTITITGDGTGATANLHVGAETGTYPGAVSYYQQRRVYANTINNPNTYYMSGDGVYTNFDFRIPSIDTDAITGTPWSQQVNGIQFMLSMPGGLVVLTGLGAWQVTGAGGSSFNPQPITPATQIAQPQTYNGCSSTVPPIRINTDIIYGHSKGSTYRDLTYQFFTNIYTGTDLTIYASHLFFNYTVLEHAWSEEPYKIIWAVRSDGVLLSLTVEFTTSARFNVSIFPNKNAGTLDSDPFFLAVRNR